MTLNTAFDDITQIFVSIHGTDSIGFDVSEAVKQTLSRGIPSYLHVNEVKEQGAQFAQLADDIFSRIFYSFCSLCLSHKSTLDISYICAISG